MAEEPIHLCRCGKPLIANAKGAKSCEHCDRVCEKGRLGGCVDCKLFDKATTAHAVRTAP